MKYIFCTIVIFSLIFSCSPSNVRLEEQKIKENASKLSELILNTSISEKSKITPGIDDEWINQMKNTKGVVMIYLINSECSTCIGDYIRFLKATDRIMDEISVYGVLNNNHEALLEYYLGQYGVENFKRIEPTHILSDSQYPFINLIDQSKNVIIMKDDNVIARVKFSDNTLLLY